MPVHECLSWTPQIPELNSCGSLSVMADPSRLSSEFGGAEAVKLAKGLGTILAIAILTGDARTEDKGRVKEPDLRDESIVFCGDGLTGRDCELARGIVRV